MRATVAPSGRLLAVATPSQVRVVDLRTEEVRGRLATHGGSFAALRLESSLLVVVGSDSSPDFPATAVRFVDLARNESLAEVRVSFPVLRVSVASESVGLIGRHRVLLLDLATLAPLATVDTSDNPLGLGHVVERGRRRFLVLPNAADRGEVVVVDARALSIHTAFVAHDHPLVALEVHASGSIIATASEQGTLIRLFDLDTGESLHSFRRGMRPSRIRALAFQSHPELLLAHHHPASSSASESTHDSATAWDGRRSPLPEFLAVASESGTVHLFRFDGPVRKTDPAARRREELDDVPWMDDADDLPRGFPRTGRFHPLRASLPAVASAATPAATSAATTATSASASSSSTAAIAAADATLMTTTPAATGTPGPLGSEGEGGGIADTHARRRSSLSKLPSGASPKLAPALPPSGTHDSGTSVFSLAHDAASRVLHVTGVVEGQRSLLSIPLPSARPIVALSLRWVRVPVDLSRDAPSPPLVPTSTSTSSSSSPSTSSTSPASRPASSLPSSAAALASTAASAASAVAGVAASAVSSMWSWTRGRSGSHIPTATSSSSSSSAATSSSTATAGSSPPLHPLSSSPSSRPPSASSNTSAGAPEVPLVLAPLLELWVVTDEGAASRFWIDAPVPGLAASSPASPSALPFGPRFPVGAVSPQDLASPMRVATSASLFVRLVTEMTVTEDAEDLPGDGLILPPPAVTATKGSASDGGSR